MSASAAGYFGDGSTICERAGLTFGAPRSAKENAALLVAMREVSTWDVLFWQPRASRIGVTHGFQAFILLSTLVLRSVCVEVRLLCLGPALVSVSNSSRPKPEEQFTTFI